MSTSPPTSSTEANQKTPLHKTSAAGKSSIHAAFLEQTSPDWLINATPARRAELKAAPAHLPHWYQEASVEQKQILQESFAARFKAQTRLDKTMSALLDVEIFAARLLVKALKEQFAVEVDVNKTLVCLKRPLEISVLEIEVATFDVLKLSLLQAALHNFEASECEHGAFHEESSFIVETTTPDTFQVVDLNITIRQFLSLCRTLDIGAQYQVYVKAFFHPSDADKEATLRQQFIASQKAALLSAAAVALLRVDIEPNDYEMIRSLVDGEMDLRLGGKQVWFCDLALMKRRMIGCAVFLISEKYRYGTDVIIYIPDDPVHPLKRYPLKQMKAELERRFTARDAQPPKDDGPTKYQRFFSQFVAYSDRPYYVSQFTKVAADSPTDFVHSTGFTILRNLPPLSPFLFMNELPPERQVKRVRVENPYLDPSCRVRKGDGLWSLNTDFWTYLFEQHRDRVIADARSQAVPTDDVDARVRAERLNHLLEIGMLGLNLVSMFVPVLGEVMMMVMVDQLLYETFEGVIEWSEGDRTAAKAHLIDVAENLAFIAVMAGAGKGLARLTAVAPEPVVEGLEQIQGGDGKKRLWKPDLSAYEQQIVLDGNAGPDALGQYSLNGKSYIRQAGKVYETRFDPSLKKWRIKHPADTSLWQPILEHNGHGAWRHTLERPLEWDRLTLLRRIGHTTECFADKQLLKIAQANGIGDDALRKMHMDHLPPPPDLMDALSLSDPDPQVIGLEQGPVAMLRRVCPGLGESAAKRVLMDADAEELTRFQTTRRVPLRMLEEARWYAQQGRVSRAFVDLNLGEIITADSQSLALHSLEKLPGWSNDVRLEIREGHVDGPLIDGIGGETAVTRKYLVKNGPGFQAFDERGEALNSVPRDGNNFFASIMHALPDEARQALGVPHTWQSGDLQKAMTDCASEHRAELAQRLEQRKGNPRRFKPPVRVRERVMGYYASGRGQGVNPSLVSRVQVIYPALTDAQANGFILEQLRAGKTDPQIYGLLQARLREWELLESTLDQWAGVASPDTALQSMLGGRSYVARAIKQSWRNSPLADSQFMNSALDLTCDDPLPALSADFSHVRHLQIRGQCINDSNANALLHSFPGLTSLRITATDYEFTNVPEALVRLENLKSLSLYSASPFAADMPSRLNALTRLEALSVSAPIWGPEAWDFSRLRHLRQLHLGAPLLVEWPAGILELPNLERLNLRETSIRALPDAIYEGHEKLWSGLSLDWSKIPREHFKPAYEYVKNHPDHLVDVEEMVRGYCKTQVRRLAQGMNEPVEGLFNQFAAQWLGEQARFQAVEALSEEYSVLDRSLKRWSHRLSNDGAPMPTHEAVGRSMADMSIRACWRNGTFKRYGAMADASRLDLSNMGLSELPDLPQGVFPHVKTLDLRGMKAPVEQVRHFVRAFSEVEKLDLSANQLTDLPIVPGDFAKLTNLDLSSNQIAVDTAVQQRFDGLQTLEYLNLRNNPLDALDVSAMTQLKALSLESTGLLDWPIGVQDLPELTWLDVRSSKISSLPSAGLSDEMLLKTNLANAPLDAQARTALNLARQRFENARGLPLGTLERFAQRDALPGFPPVFPPTESGLTIALDLLPLPQIPVGEGVANLAKRLQRIKPALAQDEALQWVEQARASAATDAQISDQIGEWEQSFETLTRQLNGWLFTREINGRRWKISSANRRLASLRILDCWSEGLIGDRGVVNPALSLDGLQLGDLPELPAVFAHVQTLDLTGARLSAQGSDGFLKAFVELKALALAGNDLEAMPEAIKSMARLERLDLSDNQFDDPEVLYASLNRLENLQWLNLGYNNLGHFNAGTLARLETLDIRNNQLSEWPEGVLDSDRLRVLNLSGNDITTIPSAALDGTHEVLISGTDLSDNYNLSRESLEELRDYCETGSHATALGFSRAELDEMLEVISNDGVSETESMQSDEDLADSQPDVEQLSPWLANASKEEMATRTETWNRLLAEPDNAAFFHLLAVLPDTREFRVANADLTRRVWAVMEAAESNTELRTTLFANAATHGTCVDGRILSFSVLESKVFLHNALLDLPAGLAAKGRALLKLSRQMFRLDRIDLKAIEIAKKTHFDQAQVRLGYRIGLTSGWSDGLELPGQPGHMTYASGVTPKDLADVRREVMDAERSDLFFQDLIQRDYWEDYLKEKYPEALREFDEVEESEEGDFNLEEAQHRYNERQFARSLRMIDLSRQETEAIEHPSVIAPQPGPSHS